MTKLQTITGMEYLNTSEVTNMSWMFGYCSSLTSLDLSNFNTANVRQMADMFISCHGLTSLDLSSFNTSNVTDMCEMFYGCIALTTIYVGEGWSTAAVTDSEDMFYGCKKLVGGAGTTYDANHVDASYAHIDGGADNPGYFTAKSNIKGDVNCDGTVTIADAVAVLNAMAGKKVPGDANVNGDEAGVTVADFVAVLNIMAGQ
jgi:surface protein